MPYRLTRFDDPAAGMREVARERLLHAADALDGAGEDEGAATAVHTARKDLKKTRSTLRLARAGLKARAYRRENDALRALAQELSGRRDADVLVTTLEDLQARYAGRLPESAFTGLRDALGAADDPAAEPDLQAAAVELRAAAAAPERWPLELDRRQVVGGIARAYERGRAAMAACEAAPTSEHLHDWRKRVKDLGYHARLLRDVAPAPMKALRADADELAELLGDEHDLAVLAARLADADGPARDVVVDAGELDAIVADRREALREAAWAVGRRLYAERPKAFRRRVAAYMEHAAQPGRGALDPGPVPSAG